MAGRYDIVMEQGVTFTLPLIYQTVTNSVATPIDITGFEARFTVRENFSRGPIFVSSTQNGGCTATPTKGILTFTAIPNQTKLLTFTKGVYDIEIYTTAATPLVKRLLHGVLRVDKLV